MKGKGTPAAAAPRALPRATYLIKELERAVRARIDEIVQPLSLTTVQYTVLSVLSYNPGMSSAQLARRSFVSPQAANESVSALQERGLIRRKIDRAGGRALGIFLTPLGRRLLAQCDARVDTLEARLFQGVAARDVDRFRAMLRTCRDAVHEDRRAPPSKRTA